MGRTKKEAKLTFVPINPEHLKKLELNTIPQVTTGLSYVLKWAKMKTVIENLPEDSKNVTEFFKAINKLTPQTFQAKKFKDIWDSYNMEDITDYKLIALGVIEKPDDTYY